jgi:AcrR family transcriptional regulator
VSTGESVTSAPRAAARRKGTRHRTRPHATNAATRIEILKSAAAAFRRLGFHGASVEQIAAALRMKKGNLYYYFRSKEAILFACHEYSLDRLLEILGAVERSGLSPAEKLRELIVACVHLILDELHGTALFLDLEALTPAHLKAIVARRDQFDRGVRHLLREGIDHGAFACSDAKLLSFAMLGAVNWIPRWYSPKGPASSDEIAQQFAEYLVAGLRPI